MARVCLRALASAESALEERDVRVRERRELGIRHAHKGRAPCALPGHRRAQNDHGLASLVVATANTFIGGSHPRQLRVPASGGVRG